MYLVGGFIIPLAQTRLYTEADYYNLPEDVRAELIDDQLIYNQATPSRIHQTILSELHDARVKIPMIIFLLCILYNS